MNSPPSTPSPAPATFPKMTLHDKITDWASQVESLTSTSPTSPTQSPQPQSPEWQTPKAHQKAQKQRISRASKVAKEAKAAALKTSQACDTAANGEPKPIIAQAKAKKPAGPDRNWIPAEEMCHSCGIYAPHRVGIYGYMSPELPYKILNIQRKISKGTATAKDIDLHNGFAAVHTNCPATGVQHCGEAAGLVNGNHRLQVNGHAQSSKTGGRRRMRRCRHPACLVTGSHPRGRYALSSRLTPRKIRTIMANIAEGLVSEEEHCILVAYRAVHSPRGSDQRGDEVEEVDDCASVSSDGSAEIIC